MELFFPTMALKKKNSDSNGDRWILVDSEKQQDVILTNFLDQNEKQL